MTEVRLIDANELKEDFRRYFADEVLNGISAKLVFDMALYCIDNAPTVEERSRGEWIIDNEHTKNPLLWYKCNLCGVYHSPTNFCPNCGTKIVSLQN